jgi:hypothetical protein
MRNEWGSGFLNNLLMGFLGFFTFLFFYRAIFNCSYLWILNCRMSGDVSHQSENRDSGEADAWYVSSVKFIINLTDLLFCKVGKPLNCSKCTCRINLLIDIAWYRYVSSTVWNFNINLTDLLFCEVVKLLNFSKSHMNCTQYGTN